ncbi:MAG TPA: AAA family ATPase [Rudaea sp.]|nr:AAA family ATPase [Rudaea sp.]
MAHITEITLEGLLDRQDSINLKLNRGVNVFFGENGCGKTTLLKVLDAALSCDSGTMEQLPIKKAVVDLFSISENRIIRHSWEREAEKPHEQQASQASADSFIETLEGRYAVRSTSNQNRWKQSPAKRKSPRFQQWEHAFLPTTRLFAGAASSERANMRIASKIAEKELDQAFSDSVNKAWLQFYSKTLTEVRNIQESGLRGVLRHVLNPTEKSAPTASQDPAAIYQRVANFLSRQPQNEKFSLGPLAAFEQRYESDSDLKKIVDNLDEVERSIEQAMVPISRFRETISRLFSRGKSLALNNDLQVVLSNAQTLPISQLSSGEKHLIKILLTSMMAGPNSVMIDEPELSLHIDWQRVFVPTILSLNPSCQLILASHSPEIMAEVSDDCIFRL